MFANVYEIEGHYFGKGVVIVAQNNGDAISAYGRPESEIQNVKRLHSNAVVAIETAKLDADVAEELARLRQENSEFFEVLDELLRTYRMKDIGAKVEDGDLMLRARNLIIAHANRGSEPRK